MKNQNRLFATSILLFVFCCYELTLLAQTPRLRGGTTVKSGNNPVDWKGKLEGNRDIELIATFSPGAKRFVANSAIGLSINGRQWAGNLRNSSTSAPFRLTLPHGEFKTYNTTFSGYFRGDLGGQGGLTVFDRWKASEMLFDNSSEHTYLNITNGSRDIEDKDSGVHFNMNKDTSTWNTYKISKIKPPLNFTPTQNHNFQHLRTALGQHVTAVALNAKHASQGAYTDVTRGNPHIERVIYQDSETNLDCNGKDSNGNVPNPACKNMQRVYFGLSITYNCGAEIFLPEWKQLEEQRAGMNRNISAKTDANWKTMCDLFGGHEKKHSDHIRKVAEECKKFEKTTFVIEFCNYPLDVVAVREMITMIRIQLVTVANDIGRQDEIWCRTHSAAVNAQLSAITDKLLNP